MRRRPFVGFVCRLASEAVGLRKEPPVRKCPSGCRSNVSESMTAKEAPSLHCYKSSGSVWFKKCEGITATAAPPAQFYRESVSLGSMPTRARLSPRRSAFALHILWVGAGQVF